MSKEAMKLALEALIGARAFLESDAPVEIWGLNDKAITALREALAKPDFWEGYVPEPDSTCSNALRIQHKPYPRTCKKCGLGPCVELAQQALDKKAENARELGLDYEPAQQYSATSDHRLMENAQGELERIKLVQTGVGIGKPEQEPVAPKCGAIIEVFGKDWRLEYMSLPVGKHKLYTQQYTYISPPAQRTWVGLTDEERKLVRNSVGYNQFVTAGEYAEHVQKATEFKLLEKNNG